MNTFILSGRWKVSAACLSSIWPAAKLFPADMIIKGAHCYKIEFATANNHNLLIDLYSSTWIAAEFDIKEIFYFL